MLVTAGVTGVAKPRKGRGVGVPEGTGVAVGLEGWGAPRRTLTAVGSTVGEGVPGVPDGNGVGFGAETSTRQLVRKSSDSDPNTRLSV